MTAIRPEQPTPDYVPAHGLLRDKVVVVTAAAGAGIGAAVPAGCSRRARRRSSSATPTSVASGRPRIALGEEFGTDRVRTLVCDVTDEAQVRALFDAA